MTLNEEISVYRKSQARDEYGTLVTTRELVDTVYTKTRPLSGGERNASDQTESFANYRFYIHQRSDFREANILVWLGVDYDIKFIADNGPTESYMYIDAARGGAM